MALYCAAPALAEQPQHHAKGGVNLGARIGNDTGEGFVDFVVPLHSNGQSILFLNPRASLKDEGETELNLGLVARKKLPNTDVILGANAYLDRRESRRGNTFNQTGLGVEALSKWVDARLNYYHPNDDRVMIADAQMTDVDVDVSTSTSVSSRSDTETDTSLIDSSTSGGDPLFSGNSILTGGAVTEDTLLNTATTTTRTTTTTTRTIRTTTTDRFFEQFEQGREGWDAELMLRLPLPDRLPQTRLGMGYYDYSSGFDGGEGISGVKGRLEMRAGPYLTLDAEVFEDRELNDTSFFLGARLHLPFDMGRLVNGQNPFKNIKSRIRRHNQAPFNERLDEMVMRDVRIQMEESEFLENRAREREDVEVEVETTSSTSTSTTTKESVVTKTSTAPTETVTEGGEVVTVVHVDDDNSGDPGNDPGADGGTYENPHTDAAGTNSDTTEADIILVHASSSITGAIQAGGDVRVLGEGDDAVHLVDADQGQIALSETAPDAQSDARPTVGGVSISSQNVEVSNFTVNNSSISTAPGDTHRDITIRRISSSNNGSDSVINLGAGGSLDENIALSDIDITNHTGGSSAISIQNSLASAQFTGTDININGTVNDGVFFGGAAAGSSHTLSNFDIDDTGGHGIHLAANSGAIAVSGGTIDGTVGNGINVTNSDLVVQNVTLGGDAQIGGDGINVTNTTDATVAIDDTTVTDAAGAGINVDGAGGGTTTVTSFDGNTIANAGAGGALFDTVTFDAIPGGAINQVAGGTLTIGRNHASPAAGDRVQGAGLSLIDPTGDLSIATLNIANDAGTGLEVDTKSGGTTFNLATGDGIIDTTGGAATFLDPLTGNINLASVTSTNSTGNGIELDEFDGTLTIGTTTIANPTTDGIVVINDGTGAGLLNFGDTDLTGLGAGTGVDLTLANGSITFNTLDIAGTDVVGSTGIDLTGSTNAGTVMMNDTSTIQNVQFGVDLTDAAMNGMFQFGDGENVVDTPSIIDTSSVAGNEAIVITGLNEANGSYNFLDVDFANPPSNNSDTSNLAGPDVYWVDMSGAGDGSRSNPGSIAGANAATADAIALTSTGTANETIDVSSSAQGMANTLSLDTNQVLVSFNTDDIVDLSAFGIAPGAPSNVLLTGVDTSAEVENPFAGLAPMLTTTAIGNDTVTLADNADVVGVDLANGGSGHALSGTGVGGTVTVSSLNVDSGGSGDDGVNITGGDANYTFNNLSVSNTGGDGIELNSTNGNFVFNGSTTASATGAKGISLDGNGGTATFSNLTVSDPGDRGIEILNSTNDVTVGGGSYTQSQPVIAFFPVTIQDQASGTISFTNFDITGSSADDVTADLFNVQNAAGTITVTGGTWQAQNENDIVDISGGSATIDIGATILQTGTGVVTSNAVEIDNVTGGSVTFAAPITQAGTGSAVDMNGNSDGTFTFNGLVSATGASTDNAIDLTNNTNATIDFNGGLNIDTTSGTGFNATGGGMVNVTGGGNTIDTGTGTGVNIANTTIGTSGITFERISVNGAASGIVLNDTGIGGFTVTGIGTTPSAGSGGTIQNTSGDGIRLTDARNVSLSGMIVRDTGGHGIFGTGLSAATPGSGGNAFTFRFGEINNTGDAADESAVFFGTQPVVDNLQDAATFDNVVFDNYFENGIHIENDSVSADITISNTTFRNADDTTNSQAVLVNNLSGTTAQHSLTVTDSTFGQPVGGSFATICCTGITFNAEGSGSHSLTVTGSRFENISRAGSGQGISAATTQTADMTSDISGNQFIDLDAAHVGIAPLDDSTITGTINNNTFTGPNIAGVPINIVGDGAGSGEFTGIFEIDNNTISGQDFGLRLISRNTTSAAGRMDFTVTNNNITTAGNGQESIFLNSQDSATVCGDFRGNTITTSSSTFDDIGLAEQGSSTLLIAQSSAADLSAVNNSASVAELAGTPTFNSTCITP